MLWNTQQKTHHIVEHTVEDATQNGKHSTGRLKFKIFTLQFESQQRTITKSFFFILFFFFLSFFLTIYCTQYILEFHQRTITICFFLSFFSNIVKIVKIG